MTLPRHYSGVPGFGKDPDGGRALPSTSQWAPDGRCLLTCIAWAMWRLLCPPHEVMSFPLLLCSLEASRSVQFTLGDRASKLCPSLADGVVRGSVAPARTTRTMTTLSFANILFSFKVPPNFFHPPHSPLGAEPINLSIYEGILATAIISVVS